MGSSKETQPVGSRPRRDRNALGGRGSRRDPRRDTSGRARDDVHRLPRAPPDDPEHVQDRGRADAVRHARRGSHGGDSRAVDLRRPQRRHGLPPDRVRDARFELAAGGAWPGRDRARGHGARPRSVPSLLRRIQDESRAAKSPLPLGRRPDGTRRCGPCARAPEAGSDPGPPGAARHAQNPDVFFQAREAANPFYEALPDHVQAAMDTLLKQTGRRYRLRSQAASTRGSTR